MVELAEWVSFFIAMGFNPGWLHTMDTWEIHLIPILGLMLRNSEFISPGGSLTS
jgi:hypothetical protein